jgi:hypothetical protein
MPDSSALPVDILCWRPFPRQHVLSLLSRIAAPISLPHMRCGGHPLGRPMNPPVEVLMPRVTVLLARGIGFFMGSGWYRVSRRSVRAAAVSPPFPSGGILPSTASAEGKPPLFDRFPGTMTPSEFSSACMFIVQLLPS